MADLPDWVDSDEWRDTSMAARARFGFAWADLLDALAEALSWSRTLDEYLTAKAASIREAWGEEPW